MAEPSLPMKLPSSPMGTPVVYLTEIRKESPASVVAFADACPCCGNKKRRCLYPSDDPRKKILIFDLPQTSTASTVTTSSGGAAASASLTSTSLNACNIRSLSSSSSSSATADPFPSPNPKRSPPTVLTDHGSLGRHTSSNPATPPPPPPSEVKNPVAGAGRGRAPTLDRAFPERSNSSGVSCSAEDDKNQSQGSDDIRSSPKPAPAVGCSAEKVKGRGEVRLGIKCECGLTREFIFIQ